jgi:hypothetical protein
MAERYGYLPSEILTKGTTVDLEIFNIASILRLRQQKQSRGESLEGTYSQTELQDIYNKAKGINNGNED